MKESLKDLLDSEYGKTTIGFILILILMSMIAFVCPAIGSAEEVVIEVSEEVTESSYIHYMDSVISKSAIVGFSIKKYMVASLGEVKYEYIILVHGVDDYNLPGFSFDSMDKAERVMIWLAGECGL